MGTSFNVNTLLETWINLHNKCNEKFYAINIRRIRTLNQNGI